MKSPTDQHCALTESKSAVKAEATSKPIADKPYCSDFL